MRCKFSGKKKTTGGEDWLAAVEIGGENACELCGHQHTRGCVDIAEFARGFTMGKRLANFSRGVLRRGKWSRTFRKGFYDGESGRELFARVLRWGKSARTFREGFSFSHAHLLPLADEEAAGGGGGGDALQVVDA